MFYLLALLSYWLLVKRKPHPLATPHAPPPPVRSALLMGMTVTFAALSMLSKEQGVTVLAACMAYDIFIASQMTLVHLVRVVKKTNSLLRPAFWKTLYRVPLGGHHPVCLFKRVFLLFLSAIILTSLRLWVNGRGAPLFVESDNPASFSSARQTRVQTYAYLSTVNLWMLFAPSRLCYDWSMESILLVESLGDPRNIFTLTTFVFLGVVLASAGQQF